MKAKVGDWLVMKSRVLGQTERRGLISEVHRDDGSPPYVVHWLDSDHTATVFPGPDAVIVTAAEQRAADERARDRLESAQYVIAHRHGGDQ